MLTIDTPIVKDLVLVGGGHSHVIVLRRFGMRPMPGVRLTVICRELDTPYSGMLPGFVAGHYEFDDIHIDLGPLCRFAGARLYHGTAVGLDLETRHVLCANRPPVPYDVLSIDVGSTPDVGDVAGALEQATPVKPISSFVSRWEALVARIVASKSPVRVGVVGAGAGGTEMVLAMQHGLGETLRGRGGEPAKLEFHLFAAGDEPLDTHPTTTRMRFVRALAERGIKLHRRFRVAEVQPGEVHSTNGDVQAVDELLWATQAGAQDWLERCGLAVDEKGFVSVADTLESTSHNDVFAVGDCASVGRYPREKAGVFAVRQGPPLDTNLRRALIQRTLVPFRPQQRFLSLISTGDKYAVASRGTHLSCAGEWVWRWKDWIDRRFMRKFSDLPEMNMHSDTTPSAGLADTEVSKTLSSIAMRCGGCGAKVGASVLDRVMAEWIPEPRDDVIVGLHEPDDAAVIRVPADKLLVQSVDSFRAMIDDPYTFGRIAANHSLGDVYAMGAEPHTALAIATLPYAPAKKLEDTLRQMMAGAMEVLGTARTTLIGGHTSEGAELSLGFSINGLADESSILRKRGMHPDERLILTKPVGTGTLFAAHMRQKARARWIANALESMLKSNREAASCLLAHEASACTDVTGFGLLGHLVEMVKASGTGVEIELSSLPVLEGALETIAAGITSSLQPENLRSRSAVSEPDKCARDPRFPLLFDPQTAGGLLASVPGSRAVECVEQLRALGYQAAEIGRVVARQDTAAPVRVLTQHEH